MQGARGRGARGPGGPGHQPHSLGEEGVRRRGHDWQPPGAGDKRPGLQREKTDIEARFLCIKK